MFLFQLKFLWGGVPPPSVIFEKHDQIYFSLPFWLHFPEYYLEGKTVKHSHASEWMLAGVLYFIKQCQIQDFPEVGIPTIRGARQHMLLPNHQGGPPTYAFTKLYEKLHEIERTLTWRASLAPPYIGQWCILPLFLVLFLLKRISPWTKIVNKLRKELEHTFLFPPCIVVS